MSEKLSAEQLRILIVDDSDFSRNMVNQMLQPAGFKLISEANSAQMAIKLIKEKTPHVVITDIVMPEISGIELTAQISKAYPDVGIIVISSLSQEHVVLEAISAGASDFIPKPIQSNQLIESINKILSNINNE
jgi:YesN/AraC family two-component response regulator